jgi:hypothetical protein
VWVLEERESVHDPTLHRIINPEHILSVAPLNDYEAEHFFWSNQEELRRLQLQSRVHSVEEQRASSGGRLPYPLLAADILSTPVQEAFANFARFQEREEIHGGSEAAAAWTFVEDALSSVQLEDHPSFTFLNFVDDRYLVTSLPLVEVIGTDEEVEQLQDRRRELRHTQRTPVDREVEDFYNAVQRVRRYRFG